MTIVDKKLTGSIAGSIVDDESTESKGPSGKVRSSKNLQDIDTTTGGIKRKSTRLINPFTLEFQDQELQLDLSKQEDRDVADKEGEESKDEQEFAGMKSGLAKSGEFDFSDCQSDGSSDNNNPLTDSIRTITRS